MGWFNDLSACVNAEHWVVITLESVYVLNNETDAWSVFCFHPACYWRYNYLTYTYDDAWLEALSHVTEMSGLTSDEAKRFVEFG